MRQKLGRATTPIRRDGDADDRSDDWEGGLEHELLANDRRRECVRYLAERGSPDARVPARELAEHVTRTLGGEPEHRGNLHQSVYTSLTQHHLTKLDEHGVVDYRYRTKTVTIAPNFETLTRAMDAADSPAPRRSFGTSASAIGLATCANLLLVSTAYPQLPTVPMVGVAILNLVPVGLFARARFADFR